MSSDKKSRYTPLRQAADLVGRRFHSDWSDSDPDALDFGNGSDPEAYDRADDVQSKLLGYIAEGYVRAYQYREVHDTGAIIEIPRKWYADPSFRLCIRTSRYVVHTDIWSTIFVDRPELDDHIPKIAKARKAGTYHSKDVVHQAWKLALCEDVPVTKAALTRLLSDWCARDELYPDATTLSDIVSEVVDFLNENKLGPRVYESLTLDEPTSEMK